MATYKNQKTYNISPTSGDTKRDGVNANVAKTPSQLYKTQQLNDSINKLRQNIRMQAKKTAKNGKKTRTA